jgi:hypothetical protein
MFIGIRGQTKEVCLIICQRAEKYRHADTRACFIGPLLSALGWSKIEDAERECSVPGGR